MRMNVSTFLAAAVAAVALWAPSLASADKCADECKQMVVECKKGCKMVPMGPEAKAACPEQCSKTESKCVELCKSGAFDDPSKVPAHDDHGHHE